MSGWLRRARFASALAVLLAAAAACRRPGLATAPSAVISSSATPAAAPPASSASARSSAQAAPAMPGKNVPAIKVDTVGYPLAWRKLAIFNVAPVGAVVKDEAGKLVYTFSPSDIADRGKDSSSLDAVWQVDFSV